MRARKKKKKNLKQSRMYYAIVILAVAFLILVIKLMYLQIIDSTDQYSRQVDQLVEEVPLKASRGNIYDRNMRILVQDSSATAIHVIPLEVKEPEKLAKGLSEKLNLDYQEVLDKVNKTEDDKVEVKNGVKKGDGEKVVAGIPEGVSFLDGTVYAVPDEIKDPDSAAQVLVSVLGMDYDDAHEVLTRKENSAVLIEGKVDNTLAREIKEDQAIKNEKGETKSYNGIELIEDKRRYYTNGNFASYVLGFTGQDHTGLTGVESSYNDQLKGDDGIIYFQKDAQGNQIPSQTKVIKEPTQGQDLTLTIDSNIQMLAERGLKSAVEEWKAKSGTAIVMDTKTGEIIAMATQPDYNLNDPYSISDYYSSKHAGDLKDKSKADQLSEMWKNPAVSFIYEPGSTFKAVTASSALEEGVVTPDTKVYCSGSININGVTVNCTGSHGTQTVSEAIANSCNPGLVQIIQKLDPALFYQYVYNYGFGKQTGIELPGEEAGIINRPFDGNGEINLLDYATFSFGQGLATTPIQLLSALNCVVNNGYYMNPTIIGKGSSQQEYVNNQLNGPKQIISSDTSAEMRNIMKNVVAENSTLASLAEGYSIGGKTGTAEKFVDGAYNSTYYVTSFFCYAPVEDPRYSILLVLDEPDPSAFGGTSAAPTAINLMKQVLDYMGGQTDSDTQIQQNSITVPDLIGQEKDFAVKILEEKGIKYKLDVKGDGDTVISQSFPAQSVYDPNTELVLEIGSQSSENGGKVTVPDLNGMSIQSVNESVTGLGLNLKVTGSGFAAEQSPAAGTVVDKGSEISVTFKP